MAAMVYVRRDGSGKIDTVSSQPQPGMDPPAVEEISSDAEEVQAFLAEQQAANPNQPPVNWPP